MKSDLDHLPERQQRELERVQAILLEEFDKAIERATQPHKRNGKVYKVSPDDKVQEVAQLPEGSIPNGVTLDRAGNFVYDGRGAERNGGGRRPRRGFRRDARRRVAD